MDMLDFKFCIVYGVDVFSFEDDGKNVSLLL